MYDHGLQPLDVVTFRVVVAWLGFAAVVGVTGRGRGILSNGGWRGLATHGFVAVVLYNLLYFAAIQQLGVSLSVALLYTAPAWSAVLSALFLGERPGKAAVIAVPLCVIGVALAVGALTGGVRFEVLGLATGLGAGLTYALFSVLGKPILNRWAPLDLLFVSFGVGSICLLMLFTATGGWARLGHADADAWTLLLIMGVFATFLAYIAYTTGLRYVDASKATILATIEPAVAVTLASVVTSESLGRLEFAGVILIIAAGTMAGLTRIRATAHATSPV
jgi:drug/metabolite transporter (DMT)-like permease